MELYYGFNFGFYIPIIAAIVIGIILFIMFSNNSKDSISQLEKLANDHAYELIKCKAEYHHYVLKTSNNTYYLCLLNVPDYSEIIINNKNTWELRYGAGNTPGKAQPNKRYLKEIKNFLSKQYDGTKVVLINPKPKKVARWLNESEMKIITKDEIAYDTYAISTNDLESFIK